jgi:hypothetical protein
MDDGRLIPVSPRHSVRLTREFVHLIERPPQRDFVVRTLAKRQAGSLLLMLGELVIAGFETRERHPLAKTYPLHFRKTYFPGRLHGDPQSEFENHQRASAIIGLPPPIGWSLNVFRSCLLPGRPYSRLSPFGAEPEERNIDAAHKLDLAPAAGLWRLVEEALRAHELLHQGGLAHGDAQLHNLIVCPKPLELLLIDFESGFLQTELDPDAWRQQCEQDLVPLLREAVFIQCALGRQQGALAELSWERLKALVRDPDRFKRAIEIEAGESSSSEP